MDVITQLFADLITFFQGNIEIVFLGIVFLVTAMIIATLASMVGEKHLVKLRLDPLSKRKMPTKSISSIKRNDQESFWNVFIEQLQKRGFPNSDRQDTALNLRMIQAGYSHPSAGQIYFILRIALCIGLPLSFLMISPFLSRAMEIDKLTYLIFLLAIVGMYLPYYWVRYRKHVRNREILDSFPDALDLFVVCVEAGLGLDAAFIRVGTQISRAHPVLSSELAMVALELRAGRSREDALRNLSDRSGVQEVQSLVTLLVQTEKLGSSIANSLRVYSAELRLKRIQKAEEKAHMLPVLLSVPLVAFILPTMITVVMLPGILNIIRVITPALTANGGP